MLASVLLSAGVWSWLWLNSAPRLGTWTDTGTVIQLIGEPVEIVYMGSGESAVEYNFDHSEFDSSPQIEEGDRVTVWVASVPDSQSTVSYDWRIIKLQSQRGTWTAKD